MCKDWSLIVRIGHTHAKIGHPHTWTGHICAQINRESAQIDLFTNPNILLSMNVNMVLLYYESRRAQQLSL